MSATASGILVDVIILTLLALVVGLVTFAVVRQMNPLLRWHEHGNVWTSPLRFEDLIVVFVLVGYHMLVVVSAIYLKTKGGDAGGTGVEEDAKTLNVVLSIIITLLVTGALLFFLTHLRRIELSEIFGLRRLRPQQVVLWSVVATVAVFPLVMICYYLVWEFGLKDVFGGEIEEQSAVELMRSSSDDPMLQILLVASACVVAPLTEEIMFRGFIYATLKRYSERFFAAVVTSALFAVVHINVPSLVPLWLLAMFLTLAYELTGCLWVPILMHALFNAAQTVILFIGMGNGG